MSSVLPQPLQRDRSSAALGTSLLPACSGMSRFSKLLSNMGIHDYPGRLARGVVRRGDPEIVSAARAICRDNPRSRILEVGCGSIWYDRNENYGPPHLAYSLAAELTQASVTASDIVPPQRMVLIGRSKAGHLILAEFEDRSAGDRVSRLCGTAEDPRLTPLEPARLSEVNTGSGVRALRALSSQGWDGSAVYLRPLIDHELSRRLFQVDMRPGVDYRKLQQTIGSEKYDFIYGRNLVGWHGSLRGTISKSIAECLNPGGMALLFIAGEPTLVVRKDQPVPSDSMIVGNAYRAYLGLTRLTARANALLRRD